MVLYVEKGEEVMKSDDALISKVLLWKLLWKIIGTVTDPNNDNWDCLKLKPSTSRYKAEIHMQGVYLFTFCLVSVRSRKTLAAIEILAIVDGYRFCLCRLHIIYKYRLLNYSVYMLQCSNAAVPCVADACLHGGLPSMLHASHASVYIPTSARW